jgi:hypothetical protein
MMEPGDSCAEPAGLVSKRHRKDSCNAEEIINEATPPKPPLPSTNHYRDSYNDNEQQTPKTPTTTTTIETKQPPSPPPAPAPTTTKPTPIYPWSTNFYKTLHRLLEAEAETRIIARQNKPGPRLAEQIVFSHWNRPRERQTPRLPRRLPDTLAYRSFDAACFFYRARVEEERCD